MKKYLALLLAVCLCLSGCGAAGTGETTPGPTAPPVVATTAPHMTTPAPTTPEPTTLPPTTPAPTGPVSALAVEDFLLPVEDNSWAREYPAEFVMIHFTSAVTLQPEDPYDLARIRGIFTDYGTSVHYVIHRDGTVYCYIPEDRVAWHAGAGSFAGDEKYTNKMNYYAIGIELLGIGSQEDMSLYLTQDQYNALDSSLLGFTDAQYEALALLVADICRRNGIPMDRAHIIGHQDYAPTKNDPGELFDWDRLPWESPSFG